MTLASAETSEAALLELRGARLIESATSNRELAAAQALVDEETILSLRSVHGALGLLDLPSEAPVGWEGLMGRVYTLGLDREERVFLGLTLSMVGIGNTPLSAVSDLGERRRAIILRAITRLAGNDTPAVGRSTCPPKFPPPVHSAAHRWRGRRPPIFQAQREHMRVQHRCLCNNADHSYADRHTCHLTKKDGTTVSMEVYVFAAIAPDGRFQRIEETTLMVKGTDADRNLGSAR